MGDDQYIAATVVNHQETQECVHPNVQILKRLPIGWDMPRRILFPLFV